jgi:uncharacterized membrane protein (DUF441 family)
MEIAVLMALAIASQDTQVIIAVYVLVVMQGILIVWVCIPSFIPFSTLIA